MIELDRRQFLAIAVAGGSAAAGCDTVTTTDDQNLIAAPGPTPTAMATDLTDVTYVYVADRTELHDHQPDGPTIYWVGDPGELKTYNLTNA